jgi:hypothetical protein
MLEKKAVDDFQTLIKTSEKSRDEVRKLIDSGK